GEGEGGGVALGGAGEGGKKGGGGGHAPAVFAEVMLGHPGVIETEPVQLFDLAEHAAIKLADRAIEIRNVRWQIVSAEFHAASNCSNMIMLAFFRCQCAISSTALSPLA